MANIKSAEKKARQAVVRNARNRSVKSTVTTAEKNLRDAFASEDKSKLADLFKVFSSRITRAAQRGVMHKSTASRKIGRMASFIGSK